MNPDMRKAPWKNINVRSKFQKKYFANAEKYIENFERILCIEPEHEKSPMEKH